MLPVVLTLPEPNEPPAAVMLAVALINPVTNTPVLANTTTLLVPPIVTLALPFEVGILI